MSRKLFLNLDGLGIRDLTLRGDDLLILAGPTMDLSGPAAVFRWADALGRTGCTVVPRQALSRPKRAARRFPTTAANSASGSVAACSLRPASHDRGSLR